MKTLVRHRTSEGTRYGVIVHEGRKWIRIHYVAYPRPVRLPKSELRFISEHGTLTNRQRARFNKSVVRAGGKRGAI